MENQNNEEKKNLKFKIEAETKELLKKEFGIDEIKTDLNKLDSKYADLYNETSSEINDRFTSIERDIKELKELDIGKCVSCFKREWKLFIDKDVKKVRDALGTVRGILKFVPFEHNDLMNFVNPLMAKLELKEEAMATPAEPRIIAFTCECGHNAMDHTVLGKCTISDCWCKDLRSKGEKVTLDFSKYFIAGEFTSTHGIKLNGKYEFDLLDKPENQNDTRIIMNKILELRNDLKLFAIHSIHPNSLTEFCDGIYSPKTNEWNFDIRGCDYVIYDDVITTGKTIEECIKRVGKPPKFVICLVDRSAEARIKLSFEIKSFLKTPVPRTKSMVDGCMLDKDGNRLCSDCGKEIAIYPIAMNCAKCYANELDNPKLDETGLMAIKDHLEVVERVKKREKASAAQQLDELIRLVKDQEDYDPFVENWKKALTGTQDSLVNINNTNKRAYECSSSISKELFIIVESKFKDHDPDKFTIFPSEIVPTQSFLTIQKENKCIYQYAFDVIKRITIIPAEDKQKWESERKIASKILTTDEIKWLRQNFEICLGFVPEYNDEDGANKETVLTKFKEIINKLTELNKGSQEGK